MQKALRIAQLVALLSAGFACASLGAFAIVATRDMEAARTQAAGLATKLSLELDELHRLTLEAGLTGMEARKASAKEVDYLDKWNAGLAQTITNANAVLASLRNTVDQTGKDEAKLVQSAAATMDATTETVNAAKPAVEDLGAALQQLQSLETAANQIVADPNIPKMIAGFAVTSDNLAVVSTDGRQVVEKYAHPTKKKLGFWSSIWAAAQVVHKVSPPLF